MSDRVAAGIAWLDSNVENWRSKINLDTLHMRNSSNCILGQVFGSCWLVNLSYSQMIALGFYTGSFFTTPLTEDAFSTLKEEWVTALAETA